MMMTPLTMSLFATNLFHNSGAAMFGANQNRMALANGATGQESPEEVADLAQQDKALQLDGIKAQTNYLVAQAMQEGAQNMRKKDQEQKQRLIGNGALFI